ncbi:MAG TPA: carbohydrate ABC transporter permease [Clostridiaceae bacterium]|nr:carbohydrate ABC transporter permease [Clostridiaceae bacterium]
MKYRSDRVFNVINYSLMIFLAAIMLYPLWYVLMYSLSEPQRYSVNNYYLIPNGFNLSTYKYIIVQPLIIRGFKNSVFVTVMGTFISLLLTSFTAYPLSREVFVGKKFFFNMIIFTMLFSGGIIPTYLVVRALGLLDSLWALILPSSISVFNMLVMMKFFKNIPVSLIESAKIDGYNDIYILFKIVLPLSKAVLASIGLFSAVGYWNTYLPCLIYITDVNKRVMQVILRGMLQAESLAAQTGAVDQIITPQNMKMAVIIVTMLPIICVYPFLQKHFVKGMLIGSIKG